MCTIKVNEGNSTAIYYVREDYGKIQHNVESEDSYVRATLYSSNTQVTFIKSNIVYVLND